MNPFVPAYGAHHALRIGFLPLTDAAPVIVAQQLGFFRAANIDVHLSREVGWATVREKILYGELDAAPALAPMLWGMTLGIGSVACPVLTGAVLSLNGNAITLSQRIREEGTDPAALRRYVRARSGERRATFGVVFPFSSHNVLLRSWLRSSGIDPDHDVRLVVVPPAQMHRNLLAGTIDGYCVGEPWNSLAIADGIGWSPASGASLLPGRAEKVLMVTEKFARARAAEHAALIGAVVAAARWCDEPENREAVAEMLSAPHYLNVDASLIMRSLAGRFETGVGPVETVPNFQVFARGDASDPTPERALAVQQDLERENLLPAATDASLPRRLFRQDLHRHACQLYKHEQLTSQLPR